MLQKYRFLSVLLLIPLSLVAFVSILNVVNIGSKAAYNPTSTNQVCSPDVIEGGGGESCSSDAWGQSGELSYYYTCRGYGFKGKLSSAECLPSSVWSAIASTACQKLTCDLRPTIEPTRIPWSPTPPTPTPTPAPTRQANKSPYFYFPYFLQPASIGLYSEQRPYILRRKWGEFYRQTFTARDDDKDILTMKIGAYNLPNSLKVVPGNPSLCPGSPTPTPAPATPGTVTYTLCGSLPSRKPGSLDYLTVHYDLTDSSGNKVTGYYKIQLY